MATKNKLGGIDVLDKDALARAKEADLLTFDKDIEGTNCANCDFVQVLDKKELIGFCKHPKVLLPVTGRQCCAFWSSKGSIRAWEKK